jgi:hypothetical protein
MKNVLNLGFSEYRDSITLPYADDTRTGFDITVVVKAGEDHGTDRDLLTTMRSVELSASQRLTVTDLHFQIEGEPTYLSTVTVRNGKDAGALVLSLILFYGRQSVGGLGC